MSNLTTTSEVGMSPKTRRYGKPRRYRARLATNGVHDIVNEGSIIDAAVGPCEPRIETLTTTKLSGPGELYVSLDLDSQRSTDIGKTCCQRNSESDQPHRQTMQHNASSRHSNRRKSKKVDQAVQSVHSQPIETISDRIQDSLTACTYECMICCDTIKRQQSVWEDSSCWAVFHLKCIQKWARRAVDLENNSVSAFWRCPGCQYQHGDVPRDYVCWCEKRLAPEVNKFIAPHSCGDTCGKARISEKYGAACPHTCPNQCHPGPCPPCREMGPIQQCFCGKQSRQVRCIDTDYHGGWSCLHPCGEVMPCDIHKCEQGCHPGLCGPCQVELMRACYCGEEQKSIKCSDERSAKTSNNGSQQWSGYWDCAKICGRLFDCNVHACTQLCHSQASASVKCPFAPDSLKACPCDKTLLRNLISLPRKSCQDPVPTCGETCGKLLPCGHSCPEKCHHGVCLPCKTLVQGPCQCGASIVESICSDYRGGFQPSCEKVCRMLKSCGRHSCNNKCCSGYKSGYERFSKREKGRIATQQAARTEEFEAEHVCTLPCGKQLQCGSHTCGLLCHAGYCSSCLDASFEELSCNCGRTRIMPPIPCGTKPPLCPYQCTRQSNCRHPKTNHNCHLDEEDCPQCPYLVEKECACGKSKMKNQPCYRKFVSCGQKCNNVLPCGGHCCLKTCHQVGECSSACQQICGKARKGCGHDCRESCHSPFPCPEDARHPCLALVTAVCPCGTVTQLVKCNSMTASHETTIPRSLKCTNLCAVADRNRRLTEALQIDPERIAQHPCIFDENTLNYFEHNRTWAESIEQAFRSFCVSTSPRYAFPPMKQDQRQFIHELAVAYNLGHEAQDPEPYRNVVLRKTLQSVVPIDSLSDAFDNYKRSLRGLSTHSLQTARRARKAYNCFVLVTVRIGILVEDIYAAIDPLTRDSKFGLDVQWIAEEDVLLVPTLLTTTTLTTEDLEHELLAARTRFRARVIECQLATTCELGWVDQNGDLLYRETRKSRLSLRAIARQPDLVSLNTFDLLG